MKKVLFILTALSIMVLTVVSCGNKENSIKVNEGIAARIGDLKISDKEIDEMFEQLPDNQKDDYKGTKGRARFVDHVINDELFLLEANSTNLKDDPVVKEELEAIERRVLIGAYYTRKIVDEIEIDEKEIEDYYNANQALFTNQALLKAQHIFSEDSMKCVSWRERIVDGGEKFSAIAKAESEDESTSEAYGSLGYFNLDGYIKFIGRSKSFSEAIAGLEVGEVSEVIKHERGYSIVRLNEYQPSSVKPLSEVRKTIVDKLRQAKVKENLDIEIEKLRKKYKPENYVHKQVLETTRTPEQLWEIAQAEDASYTRILFYRELVQKYPDHKYAPQALFMIGFVYAEELQDLVQARRTFDELIKKYPDSDVVESAQYMIDNLNNPRPKFESIEGVKEQVEKDKE